MLRNFDTNIYTMTYYFIDLAIIYADYIKKELPVNFFKLST